MQECKCGSPCDYVWGWFWIFLEGLAYYNGVLSLYNIDRSVSQCKHRTKKKGKNNNNRHLFNNNASNVSTLPSTSHIQSTRGCTPQPQTPTTHPSSPTTAFSHTHLSQPLLPQPSPSTYNP